MKLRLKASFLNIDGFTLQVIQAKIFILISIDKN
jgi:hypothetical protein